MNAEQLAAVEQLHRDLDGRADEVGQFLLEYLAAWGADGIDVQALAQRVIDAPGEE